MSGRTPRLVAHVRVPATSANLGPGFDTAGLALGLWDELEVGLVDGPTRVTVVGEGAADLPEGEDHLVVRAVRAGLEAAGVVPAGVELWCTNRIPHGRGMGSSAAAVVGGLVAARALVGDAGGLDDGAVLALATEFEGHPDNAAPALLGGATIAWTEAGRPRAARIPVDPALRLTVLVPPAPVLTRAARAALPAQVPHADAAFNAGRAALLVLALEGRSDLLMAATEDRLHQPFRADVLGPSLDVVHRLRGRGLPAVVSGAGPSVLVLGPADDTVRREADTRGWLVHESAVATGGAVVRPQGERQDATGP